MHTTESLQTELAALFPGLMGVQLKQADKDRVVATMVVRADLCTTGGALHGGAIMAFADTLGAVGTFQNLLEGAHTTTIDSTTKFIGSVPMGSTVIGECVPFHRGRTTMVWQTLIKSDAGEAVCCGYADTTRSGPEREHQVMQIGELGSEHARAFQELRLAALCECPSAFASSYEEEHDTPIGVVAERLVAKPDRCLLGAWLKSDLVGMVGLQREQMRKLSHKAFIWGMYVAPAARRRGMGGQLLAHALARAASMPGVRQINLGVNAANAEAVALYEAAGFTAFGLERGFMLLDGRLHDEIHMVRTVETAATK